MYIHVAVVDDCIIWAVPFDSPPPPPPPPTEDWTTLHFRLDPWTNDEVVLYPLEKGQNFVLPPGQSLRRAVPSVTIFIGSTSDSH